MKETKKIYVVGGSIGYANWLLDMGMEITEVPEEADIALFTGGADIDPAFYGEQSALSTYCSPQRDRQEDFYYEKFLNLETPMLGICRGGQLFVAKAGGRLVQHSTHPYSHKVITKDNVIYQINSMHHQQFLIEGMPEEDVELIAWAENLSPYHLDQFDVDYGFAEDYKEPEVCFLPKAKALAIQCHPECLGIKRTMDWFEGLVRQYLLQEKEELEMAA